MFSDRLVHGALSRIGAIDAETAHNLAIGGMRLAQVSPLLLERITRDIRPQNPVPVEICGIKFPHRVGAAAGLDKQGQVLPFLQAMGFGFVEVGSVPPRQQPGNTRKRFFLLPEDRAAINRFGFNSDGAEAIAEHMERDWHRVNIPIGVSLGVNKEDAGDVPKMLDAFKYVIRVTARYASYYVVNVSSPNTKNLRDTQAVGKIRVLADGVVEAAGNTPVFIKFSPDMSDDELCASVETCLEVGVSGSIVTNTTLGRDGLMNTHRHETGGLSGAPLFERSLSCIKLVRSIDSSVPIIGVGGVSDYDDASAMFAAGANLVQFYTALFYQGLRSLQNISDT